MAELSIVESPVSGLPEWVEPSFRFTPGMDPLGLRALTAARVVAPLVPICRKRRRTVARREKKQAA